MLFSRTKTQRQSDGVAGVVLVHATVSVSSPVKDFARIQMQPRAKGPMNMESKQKRYNAKRMQRNATVWQQKSAVFVARQVFLLMLMLTRSMILGEQLLPKIKKDCYAENQRAVR